jgi:hypothetical protein
MTEPLVTNRNFCSDMINNNENSLICSISSNLLSQPRNLPVFSIRLDRVCIDPDSRTRIKAPIRRKALTKSGPLDQAGLPNEPTWVRVGRYELVDNLSPLDVVDIFGGGLSQSTSC